MWQRRMNSLVRFALSVAPVPPHLTTAKTTMRSETDEALKSIVVPHLRVRGFKGTYPHFFRECCGHIDLLTFQFRSSGGSFVCEISFADQERSNVAIYRDTEPKRLRTNQTRTRLRLGAMPDRGVNDHWFCAEDARTPSTELATKAAHEVLALLESQGDPWWTEQRTRTGKTPQNPTAGNAQA